MYHLQRRKNLKFNFLNPNDSLQINCKLFLAKSFLFICQVALISMEICSTKRELNKLREFLNKAFIECRSLIIECFLENSACDKLIQLDIRWKLLDSLDIELRKCICRIFYISIEIYEHTLRLFREEFNFSKFLF